MSRSPKFAMAEVGWPWLASLVAHASLLSVAGVIAFHLSRAREPEHVVNAAPRSDGAIAIDLPTFSDGSLHEDRAIVPEGTPPETHGGELVARVDTGAPGRGGQSSGARATNLAAVDDAMRRAPDLASRLDRDQEQRMKTASLRRTHEDRRATTHPMELTFLVSGRGEHVERRPEAPVDPSRGSLVAPRPASVVGGSLGARDALPADGPAKTPGASRAGQLSGSPGTGLRSGAVGTTRAVAARVGYARPAVTEAQPTVTAAFHGRPHDTVDSDQEVAALVQSHVRASYAGALAGEGKGGSHGPEPDPGAGGGAAQRGSVARPLGSGDGDIFDWNTTDPLLLPYFRGIHAKVDPLWKDAFPRSALLELKQGTVILEFVVAADGAVRVAWPPARPSGIDEFDRNCADAIRRAGPFEPIPSNLRALGHSTLRIRAPFVARNPIVQ